MGDRKKNNALILILRKLFHHSCRMTMFSTIVAAIILALLLFLVIICFYTEPTHTCVAVIRPSCPVLLDSPVMEAVLLIDLMKWGRNSAPAGDSQNKNPTALTEFRLKMDNLLQCFYSVPEKVVFQSVGDIDEELNYLEQDDPRLVEAVRDSYLLRPSNKPLNLGKRIPWLDGQFGQVNLHNNLGPL